MELIPTLKALFGFYIQLIVKHASHVGKRVTPQLGWRQMLNHPPYMKFAY